MTYPQTPSASLAYGRYGTSPKAVLGVSSDVAIESVLKQYCATQVRGAVYSLVDPTPTGTEPVTIAVSSEMVEELGLDLGETERPEFAQYFSGNSVLPQISGCVLLV